MSVLRSIFLLLPCLFLGCATSPVPTGDRIVSVSWENQRPTQYALVTTTFCEKENAFTLEGLPAYSEVARTTGFDLVKSCTVAVQAVIDGTPLSKQSAFVPPPTLPARDRRYHLRIRVHPRAPPALSLEPAARARQRLKNAGRSLQPMNP